MANMDWAPYEVFAVKPGVTGINDETDATSYLIEGSERALLIDTGWGDDRFEAIVHSLTDKPVSLAVTHMHRDHILHAGRFETVYMHPADAALLKASGKTEPWVQRVRPLRDGDAIDLGDERVEVIEVSGHTPGSLVFLAPGRGVLCTGDAIGSGEGVWMQVTTATPLSDFQRSLRYLLAWMTPYGDDVTYLGGHKGQGKDNPLTLETVRDMIVLIDEIAAGTAEKKLYEIPGKPIWAGEAYIAKHGKADIVYRPVDVLG